MILNCPRSYWVTTKLGLLNIGQTKQDILRHFFPEFFIFFYKSDDQ